MNIHHSRILVLGSIAYASCLDLVATLSMVQLSPSIIERDINLT